MIKSTTSMRTFLSEMERSEKLYNHYLTSGHTYQYAVSLKDCNLYLQNVINRDTDGFPLEIGEAARKLLHHYDIWLRLWNEHNATRDFKPNDTFVFESLDRFPKRAAELLSEYYRTQSLDILFIGKKNDPNASYAAEYVRQIFPRTTVLFGGREEGFPEEILWWQGDYIFSYLSPWIIPESLLQRAAKGAINWHPGPPEYPGIGCTNFAVYNQECIFGITCHHMLSKVDTGNIIEVHRFKVLANDTVYSITQKCYACILKSFLSIIAKIATGDSLPQSTEKWARKPYTRKELNALCKITPDMTIEEAHRRIKATIYDHPWAYTEIQGIKFYLK
ncbi:formyltransferase family protein [uncultured Rikenella sp.]|uniref:formyltransferase family protein n=1 Tax=uncultured Rikenella sp. TaxID=368003 RepID=UPI0026022401|nr:formyltransferase family protein [uncultured Rikenella sp.]